MQIDSRRASSESGSEAGGKNKRRLLALYSCRTKTWQFKNDSQEYSKVGAHGYVFTYPGSFYALIGMEWVWGICIGVGSALLFDCHGSARFPVRRIATVQIPTPFFINPVAEGYWRH